MKKTLTYHIHDVEPYINWLYFFHAWGLSGKPATEQQRLRAEAEEMLRGMDQRYKTHATFGLFEANSDGDDIIVGQTRIPLLRQQHQEQGQPNLCLSDFIRPAHSGVKDIVGVFASTVDHAIETDSSDDPYSRMMAQTLADRLAEATAEKMHEEVRRNYWGYAPDEHLSIRELHMEAFQGIRPAIGYPSLPDTSLNFVLNELIDMKSIGIRLTENGMMIPHASVSGFMFAHPQAHYFTLGAIGEDQLADYAHRRGIPLMLMRKFLESNLIQR